MKKRNDISTLLISMISAFIICVLFLVPANAYLIEDVNNIDPVLFEQELDLQFYEWYLNPQIKDNDKTINYDGNYIDKNGVQYLFSVNGTAAVLEAITTNDPEIKTVVVPEKVNLYKVTTAYGNKEFDMKETQKDKFIFTWSSPKPTTYNEDGSVKSEGVKGKIIDSTCMVVGVSKTFSVNSNVIEEIILPNSIKTLDSKAFANNDYVKRVYLPEITRIGSSCFQNCRELEYVYHPELQYIENYAFKDCFSLKSFDLTNIIHIGDNAFYNCSSLESISLPATLQYLGTSAFEKCNNAENLYIPKGISISTITKRAFADCTSLKKIAFPYEIVTLDTSSFEHCDNLKYIDLTNSNIATIGKNAFFGSLNVEYALLPKTLKSFNATAFDSCPSLRYVYFANELTSSQLTSINKSYIGECSITTQDKQGPLAAIAGSTTATDTLNITKAATINVFDQVDVASIKIVYEDNTEIKPKNITSKVYGYKTLAYSFEVEEYGKYVVTATDVLGNEQTITINYTLKPIKPGSTTKIKATQTTSYIKLSWEAVPNATGYRIYKYDATTKKYTKLTSTTKTTYTFKNLKAGTKYTYLVRAYSKSEEGYTSWADYSTKDLFYTATKPGTTSKLTATQTTNTVKLTWNKVTGATGYRVYVYENNKWTKITSTTKTTYTIKNLKSGTTYKYAIKAYVKNNSTAVFADSFKTLTTATKPATPTLKATAGVDKATLSWNKITGATGYEVYYATSKTGTYKKAKTTTSKSYIQNYLTTGKTYYFKVRAYKTVDGAKVYSDFSSVKYAKIK